jgi:ornithine decarboxylase
MNTMLAQAHDYTSIPLSPPMHILSALQQEATPHLTMDMAEIDKQLSLFARYLPDVKLHYAVKSNPDPLIIRHFHHHGIGFDVASAGETQSVFAISGQSASLIFSNPIKDERSIRSIFERRVHAYTFDNYSELKKIAEYRRAHNIDFNPLALLRIRLRSQNVQVNLNQKFGCEPENAVELFSKAMLLGLNPAGIAFHVGTQSYLAENFITAIETSLSIAKKTLDTLGLRLKIINLGGGFPDPEVTQDAGTSLEHILRQVSKSCLHAKQLGFTLYAEPGRALVSSSGYLVTQIIGINDRDGKRWLYLDDGVYGCYSGQIFDHKTFQFFSLRDTLDGDYLSAPLVPCVIAGPTCDSIDIIADSVMLPNDLCVGDRLWSPNMGAYSLATSSNFNGFQLANSSLTESKANHRHFQAKILSESF